MRFNDLKKDELVQAAEFYKLDVNSSDTKEEITLALLDADKSPEQWADDKEAYVSGNQHQEPEEDEDEDSDEPKKAKEEMVLVRFVGKNRSYSIGRHAFTAVRPFALMTRDEFKALDRRLFREASKAEASEFYG